MEDNMCHTSNCICPLAAGQTFHVPCAKLRPEESCVCDSCERGATWKEWALCSSTVLQDLSDKVVGVCLAAGRVEQDKCGCTWLAKAGESGQQRKEVGNLGV